MVLAGSAIDAGSCWHAVAVASRVLSLGVLRLIVPACMGLDLGAAGSGLARVDGQPTGLRPIPIRRSATAQSRLFKSRLMIKSPSGIRSRFAQACTRSALTAELKRICHLLRKPDMVLASTATRELQNARTMRTRIENRRSTGLAEGHRAQIVFPTMDEGVVKPAPFPPDRRPRLLRQLGQREVARSDRPRLYLSVSLRR